MRFCHVSTFYPPWNFGGDGIAIQMICEALARRGHQVDVVHCADAYGLRGRQAVSAAIDPPGVHRHTLHSRLGALSPIITQQTGRPGLKHDRISEILSNSYDVVHFHNISLVGGPGVMALSQAPVTLYTTHDHWLVCPAHVLWKNKSKPCDKPSCFSCSIRSGFPPQMWRYTGLLQRSLRHVDALLCPSDFAAQRHRSAGINCDIHVHRWFSRMGSAPRDTEETPTESATDSAPLFVYAGRLVVSKGVEHLLEVFAQRPEYRLDVAGDGPLRGVLQSRYEGFPQIRFLGETAGPELERLFRRARAVVVPSWGPEVSPLTVLEALACGAPVIVRRAGGSAEAVELAGGGLIYERPEELLPLVDRLAKDAALNKTLSIQAELGSSEHFSEEIWMKRYFSIIEQIAHDKSAVLE